MNDFDFDRRKNNRRKNIEQKFSKKKDNVSDFKDTQKLKKQFKKAKEEMIQEEKWEDWEDEVS
jgi:hypothetical protein